MTNTDPQYNKLHQCSQADSEVGPSLESSPTSSLLEGAGVRGESCAADLTVSNEEHS